MSAVDPRFVFGFGSGLLLIALGAWVGLVRPRRRVAVAFGVFSAGWGAFHAFFNLFLQGVVDPLGPLGPAVLLVALAGGLFAVAGALIVTLNFPRRLPRAERKLLWLPAAVGGTLAVMFVGAVLLRSDIFDRLLIFEQAHPALRLLESVGMFLVIPSLVASFLFAITLLPLRFVAAAGPLAEQDRQHYALMAAALTLFPGVLAGESFSQQENPTFARLAMFVLLLLVVGLWFRALARSHGADRRRARNLALWTLAVPLVGAIATPEGVEQGPEIGIARLITVVLLAYAIVRHQLLGIDVKVKWTLKQSTVAAIFVAVFFGVSQGAQVIFSETLGTFAGIAAAAALVFAIHPLQHFAQRVADRAMPGVKGVEEMTDDERAATYRDLLRVAWQDGVVDRSERAMLVGLRQRLRLTADEAERLEGEVMRP